MAPYATALAAMLEPKAALDNFARLEKAGARGAYGFYEALDYTPSKLPENAKVAVVRNYMAHHQGMTIVSLGNVIHDGVTAETLSFLSDGPGVGTAASGTDTAHGGRDPATGRGGAGRTAGSRLRASHFAAVRVAARHHTPHPSAFNGRYTVMITAAGAGFSRWEDLAVTRWREDTTRDCWGTFIFLRDTSSGEVWSAGFQPSGTEMDHYEVIYAEDRAKIIQRNGSLSITLEIVVSTEDDAELRQLTVTNVGDRDREIDITSYAEVVLAPQSADEAHATFSNLFVQTEFVPELGTLLGYAAPALGGRAPGLARSRRRGRWATGSAGSVRK